MSNVSNLEDMTVAPPDAPEANTSADTSESKDQTHVWTLEALMDHCTAWQPKIAAKLRNSALCVTEPILRIRWQNKEYDLNLEEGRWVAIYVRVSTPAQRTGRSNNKLADGFSEAHQLRRCIEWCIFHRFAFRIYSDAGITSAYPPDDPALIRSLLKTKSDRYKKVYNRVWLSDSAVHRRTSEEIVSMEAYRDKKVALIKSGPFRDAHDTLPSTARRNSRVYHRQAFTQLWRDMEARSVHTVVVTDKSRLLRSADLEKLFFELAYDAGVKMKGTEEPISALDMGEEDQKGAVYMLASINEKGLTTACYNAMKGYSELLQSGFPHSTLPFWLERDGAKKAVAIEENVALVHEIIELYLSEFGLACAIASEMKKRGKQLADGRELTHTMVEGVLEAVEIGGIQRHFGLAWDVLPKVVSDETLADVIAFREARQRTKAELAEAGGPKVRAHRLFRSLAFCTCGYAVQHHDDCNLLEPIGSLLCHRGHRRKSTEYPGGHAFFPHSVLESWLDAIIPHVQHLMAAAGPAEEVARERKVSMAAIEEQIKAAESNLTLRRSEAVKTAKLNASMLGLQPSSPSYQDSLDKIAEAIVAAEVETLKGLKGQLALLTQQATSDRASVRLRSPLADVSNWDRMNVAEKNRVLRAVFDKIVISPSPLVPKRRAELTAALGPDAPELQQGSVTLYLQGVADPLPPIRMHRGGRSGRRLSLDSPSDWLRKMFGIEASEEDSAAATSPAQCCLGRAHFTPFHRYMRQTRSQASEAVGRLADAMLADKSRIRKRLTVKGAVREMLVARRYSKEHIDALDEAWDGYIAAERLRILPTLTRSHSVKEAETAWRTYFEFEERHFERV